MEKEVILQEFYRWKKEAKDEREIIRELEDMENQTEKIEDAFYKELSFGTGGLRGIIGAGTNRMNIFTVAKASQGLSDYIKDNFRENERKIAVSYDSRINSKLFSKVSAEIFAANGIKVYIYKQLMPTPCLSFAVRYLKCVSGVMITASHNPSEYNGYKVYGTDGCQITKKAAKEIQNAINRHDYFCEIKRIDFETALKNGMVEYISDSVYTSYIEAVKAQSMLLKREKVDKTNSIVYSPLNGTGLYPVTRVLKESGYTNVTVVEEQREPDGRFPTCPYPNPEVKEAMSLGIKYAEQQEAELVLATDPDCDRVGIAVRNHLGDYVLLSGNETGVLLLDYICSKRREYNTMPENPVIMKTIVTTDLAEQVASAYGVRTINVLTGFKYIGEQIGILEEKNCEDSFIFGLEESYGYLSGTYVRDKDGVNAALLICEMFAYYKSKNVLLTDKLDQLYQQFGYYRNTQYSYKFEGAAGHENMKRIMKELRSDIRTIGTQKICMKIDYKQGVDGLPQSDVLKFVLEDNCSIIVRPSGTEPKLKIYINACGKTQLRAKERECLLSKAMVKYFE